nr:MULTISPECIES: sigma-70 family RNA polymerase sigma factor [unclassified Pseudoalteromonas]
MVVSVFAVKWSEVISQNKPKLQAFLNSILHCPYLAEDALQDTYLRLAAMSKQQNNDVKNATSFTYQVARNIAIDMLRKKKRDALIDIEGIPLDELHDAYSDIEEHYSHKQLSESISNTMKKLSTRHQNIISFYRNGRFKQKEIANVYKISPTLVNFMIKEVIHSCQVELRH